VTQVRALAVPGAFAFTPAVFPDERGAFVSPYLGSLFTETLGHPLFPVRQTSYSVSRRGVLRGLHYTATPPGSAKLVCCPHGRALDLVVDLRVGSPRFGCWDSVVLDDRSFTAVYLPVGVGHAFVALRDDTVMAYLLSQEYVPANELAVSAVDPALRLPIPEDIDPVMSERDRAAPTLDEARTAGRLPDFQTCRTIEAAFGDR
jgi:5-epimerase